MDQNLLIGKTAIVTGAASGNGRAIAIRLADEGASVVVADVDRSMADETVSIIQSRQQTLGKIRQDPKFVETDVSNYASVRACVLATHELFGQVDIMINNAGINRRSQIKEIRDDDWDEVLAVNLSGVYFGLRVAADYMADAGISGSIVNVSSIRQVVAGLGNCAYATAKGGISGMTKFYGKLYAESQIGIFSVGPGYVETPMTVALLKQPGVLDHIVDQIPWGRLATPQEVASVVTFLTTPSARYLRGQTIMVDGGYLTG